MKQMKSGDASVNGPRIAGVRFQRVGKVYHFDASAHPDLRVGDYVIVETTRGRQLGQVAWLGSGTDEHAVEGPLKPIERRATGRDLAIRRYWEDKELEALEICRRVNREMGLPIKIIRAEYSFDGSRLTFLYSSSTEEEKVDTKDLRQEVSKSFRARVEMKLIGPRDAAKLLEGFGACGEVRCCARFLTDFRSVSIKMAKEQGISLNPQEITGMCGRLRCCLAYECEIYTSARKTLPARGKQVGTPYGQGTVVDILALKDSVLVQIGEQQFEIHRDQLRPPELAPESVQDESVAAQESGLAGAPPAAEPGKRSARRRRRRRAKRPGRSASKKNKTSASRGQPQD